MSKVRVVYNKDNTVSIIHPAPKSRRDGESESEWLDRVFTKATPKNVEYDDIDNSELPKDRKDRNSWTGTKNKGVSVDQNKAQKVRDEKETRFKIDKRKEEILEQQAVDALIASGDLPSNF